VSVITGPASPPPEVGDARIELANLFLRGYGLEIGALHLRTVLPPDARARYVDRMSVEDLRAHYPELVTLDLAPVEVVDDGERLETIPSESVDFIVANHFLEHCQDPIRTIETHLNKLRPGGTLFYAVPDKRYTFDYQRPRTSLQHLIDDHERGPGRSRSEHYLAWVNAGLVPDFKPSTQQEVEEKAAELEAEDYSIHFHVWTQADLASLMFHIHERLGNFEVEAIRSRGIENIVVLRKHGDPPAGAEVTVAPAVAKPALAATAPTPPSPTRSARRRLPGYPLGALRTILDAGSAAAHWSLNPDGIDGRAWVIAARSPVTVPLTLEGPVTLRAHAQLLPHDWRDGTGQLDVSVATVGQHGQRTSLWSHRLARLDDPTGVAVDCEIPGDTVALVVGCETVGRLTDGAVARFALVDPYLADPRAGGAAGRPAPVRARVPSDGPTISVLCPVHDPPPAILAEAIDSVLGQTYDRWELILSDDGSRDPRIVDELQRRADTDTRIRLTRRSDAGGISAATNDALELAAGEYVALLDHDDTLDPDALAHFAAAINAEPALDMLYSDEDIVLDRRPVWVHRKPGWSPDTLNTNGYTCHLGVYRRSLVREIGGFRSEFNGSQDVDMILRLTERTDRVGHVPEILYHWRIHPDSTAGGDAKPYAYVAARNAIADHLRRCEIDAEVEFGPPGLYRVVHRVDPSTTAAIVIAADDGRGLEDAARSWMAQPHGAWRAYVGVSSGHREQVAAALIAAGLDESRFVLVITDAEADRVVALQLTAAAADADVLLLLESPQIGLSHDWLTRLIGYACQSGIAAAGPIVLSADGRIGHAGIAVPDGLPLPLLYGERSSMDHHFGYATSVYNVSGVDGALMTARATFERLGGLRVDAGTAALGDYCLRAEDELGERSVTIGDVRLQLVGADPATNDLGAIRRFAERWRERADPYYNAALRSDRGDFAPLG
jgi:predicted SAM-dependent methyltransferase